MRASLDTNAIIHFYRARTEEELFSCFQQPLYMYQEIRRIELENHGRDILTLVDKDVAAGRILCVTDDWLKEKSVYRLFVKYAEENRLLYTPKDMGEVYAISLAKTLDIAALVTNDIKQGGPYMSLLQFEDDIMPFHFADVLLLNYIGGRLSKEDTIKVFDKINACNQLNWSFSSHVKRFIRRFWYDPYRADDKEWIQTYCKEHGTVFIGKMREISKVFR